MQCTFSLPSFAPGSSPISSSITKNSPFIRGSSWSSTSGRGNSNFCFTRSSACWWRIEDVLFCSKWHNFIFHDIYRSCFPSIMLSILNILWFPTTSVWISPISAIFRNSVQICISLTRQATTIPDVEMSCEKFSLSTFNKWCFIKTINLAQNTKCGPSTSGLTRKGTLGCCWLLIIGFRRLKNKLWLFRWKTYFTCFNESTSRSKQTSVGQVSSTTGTRTDWSTMILSLTI